MVPDSITPPIEFAPRALADLTQILRWTSETWGLDQSETYEDELFATIQYLATNVHIGRVDRRLGPGIRIWIAQEHSIVYSVIDNRPRVLRIVHQRQNLRRKDIGT